jgi:hypothetical protein
MAVVALTIRYQYVDNNKMAHHQASAREIAELLWIHAELGWLPGAKTISKGGISHIGQDLDNELVHARI